ncbi:unnamed protein product [Colias eurytheme]|nr:unnamed protein product [Colias eurytheme]
MHVCYKNYEGSSSGMESAIICEGFKASMDMYGLIYGRLIADGDSSTYSKILAADPYPGLTVVGKKECRNHLLRNMCNKLRALGKDTKYPKALRKYISDDKILSMRKVVSTSISTNKKVTGVNSKVNISC